MFDSYFQFLILQTLQMIIDQPIGRKKSIKSSKILKSLQRIDLEKRDQSAKDLNFLNPQTLTENIDNASHKLSLKQLKAIKNSQIKKYVELFTFKLKRSIALHQSYQAKEKRNCMSILNTSVESIQLPDYMVRIIVIISILTTLTLLILSTFQGFIDDFSENYTTRVEIIAIKICCLIFNLVYFGIKCVTRLGHGELAIFIHEVFWAYAQSKRIFTDFLSLLFQIFSLAYPKVMAISGAFFFLLIVAFIFSLNDVISLETTFFHKQRNMLLWGITKIAISNIIFGHLMASIILAMSRFDVQNNWIVKAQIQYEPWYVIYINSFYWGCTIMMTVGFGDLLPASPAEKVVTGFLQMFSCALLGYNISTIGSLIAQLREQSRESNRKKAVFRRMIRSEDGRHSHISKRLQIKILNYLRESSNGHENLQYLQRDEIIASLPEPLRKTYFHETNTKLFLNVSFFNRLHPNTLLKISDQIVRRSYFPNQYLQSSVCEQIILLDKGEIGLAYKRKGSKLSGQIYDNFINNKQNQLKLITISYFSLCKRYNYYLVAKNHALAWTIQFQKFQNILEQISSDYQYYFTTLHSHSFDSDNFNFILCVRCSNLESKYLRFHSIYDCPKVTFLPLKELVVLKMINQKGQENIRGHLLRKTIVRQKRFALKLKKELQINCVKFQRKIEQTQQIFEISKQEREKQNFNELVKSYKIQNEVIGSYTSEKLKSLIEEVLKNYFNQFQQQFWTVELDQANNFAYYFPQFNPSRVHKIKLI